MLARHVNAATTLALLLTDPTTAGEMSMKFVAEKDKQLQQATTNFRKQLSKILLRPHC